MSQGIAKTQAVFADLTAIAADLIGILKGGANPLYSVPALLSLMKDVQKLIADAPGMLPELKDLDGAEAAQLGSGAYALVHAVLMGLGKK